MKTDKFFADAQFIGSVILFLCVLFGIVANIIIPRRASVAGVLTAALFTFLVAMLVKLSHKELKK